MRVIAALGWNTFLEALRDKVLYLLLFFGVFLFAASRMLAPLALGEGRRISLDVGLASISLFGCLITIFVGHQMIFREIEQRTLYFVFSRPIRRSDFIWGKFLGLWGILAVAVLAMGTILCGVLALSGYSIGWPVIQAIGFVFLELTILASVALLIASFTSPILAGLLTLSAYVIGHGSGDILQLMGSTTPALENLLRTVSWFVPRLDLYGEMLPVLQNTGWTAAQYGWGMAYAFIYATASLILAGVILERRDFHL